MRKTLLPLTPILVDVLSPYLFSKDKLLKDEHPGHYTLQEGNTLSDSARMFVTDASMWSKTWLVNPSGFLIFAKYCMEQG